MCWMGLWLPGEMPAEEELKAAVRLNPDGVGWAMVTPDRQLAVYRGLDAAEAIKLFMEARGWCRNCVAVFHARYAGSMPVSLANVHPLHVGDNPDVAVFHNGYLFPAGEDGMSDTAVFAAEILPRYDLDDPAERSLLERWIGPNKVVVLSVDESRYDRQVYVLNQDQGTWQHGTWRSNDDHTGVSHLQPGRCAPCGTTNLEGGVVMGSDARCAACDQAAENRRAVLLRGGVDR